MLLLLNCKSYFYCFSSSGSLTVIISSLSNVMISISGEVYFSFMSVFLS